MSISGMGSLLICLCAIPAPAAPIVVSNALENPASGPALENTPVTLSRVGAAGDFTRGISPAIAGRRLPAQVDVLRRAPDGSIRHALVSFILPELAAGRSVEIDWLDEAPPDPAPFRWGVEGTALDLSLVFRTQAGGVLTSDVGEILADEWAAGRRLEVLRDGPVMKEVEIRDVPVDAAGKPDTHLDVIWRVRAFTGAQSVRVAAIVERCKARREDRREPVQYEFQEVALRLGDRVLYREGPYDHLDQTRYRILAWTDGPLEEIHRRPDYAYWIKGKFLPRFRFTQPTTRADVDQIYAKRTPDRNNQKRAQGILEPGIIHRHMPGTGGRWEMEPYPSWTVAYVLSGAPKTYRAILHADGNGAGAFYIHVRQDGAPGYDIRTVKPFPLSREHRIPLYTLPDGGKPPVQPDHAHAPSLGYAAYLVTGDTFYAEEMSFWASFQLGEWPYRGLRWRGMDRAFAYGLRHVVDAAFILPDDHPLRDYFAWGVNSCLDDMTAELVLSRRRVHSPPGGVFRCSGRANWINAKRCSAWQYAWAVWSLGNAADKDFERAEAVRDWAAEYIVGFYTSEDEYLAPDGKTYRYDPKDAMPYSTATQRLDTRVVARDGKKEIQVIEEGEYLENYGEIWYVTKQNVDNSYHDPKGITTSPGAEGNWPLREDGWGHGFTYNSYAGRRDKWYGWHRYGAWVGIVSAIEGGVPKAREAWDVMTSMAGADGIYGYEMVPRAATMDLAIGGTGGAYFLASPGDLWIEVQKRDRNLGNRRTHLRAILVGPDREVLQDVTIPDDGRRRGSGAGPVETARLSTRVARKGIYGLNITVSQDRYGQDIIWGFRTNCPHYLIETARGHKDERHQEPIVLLNPTKPGDVCFLPRKGAFRMELVDLPEGMDAPRIFDAEGALIAKLPAPREGRIEHTFAAEGHRGAVPWRLHLPMAKATIHLDGVTRWERGDPDADLGHWTPDLDSFFPFQEVRWLITPYSRTVFGRPGEDGEVTFRVHNNADRERRVRLALEFPGDSAWPVQLAPDDMVLGPRDSREVSLRYTVPDARDDRVCHVRATLTDDPRISTYATLRLRNGVAPAKGKLTMPIVLAPYRHENEQFGYLPDYPVANQVYFDGKNRPFVSTGGAIVAARDRGWVSTDLRTATASHRGSRIASRTTKVAFDRDDDLYLVATVDGRPAVLRSTDGGQSYAAAFLKDGRSGSFDIEQFSGHNVPEGPPPVLRYRQTATDPRLRWRRLNDLDLFLPEKTDGGLSCGDPIRISTKCIGLSAHSGIPSSVVSRGGRVHVAWAEATDPREKVPGVPTFVATYDREKGELGEPALIGYGPPPNDVHNSPCITMDSKGYLHALVGTHGRTFKYARSRRPNDAHGGWTEAVDIGPGLRQTYVGLVCDREDTLHVVFRLWETDTSHHPDATCAVLAHMRKPAGKPWGPARPLVVAAFSEYSIYYHRLTIDRLGRLFLSYDYWSTYWFYRTDHVGNRRALLVSGDGGETWKLTDEKDLAR